MEGKKSVQGQAQSATPLMVRVYSMRLTTLARCSAEVEVDMRTMNEHVYMQRYYTWRKGTFQLDKFVNRHGIPVSLFRYLRGSF